MASRFNPLIIRALVAFILVAFTISSYFGLGKLGERYSSQIIEDIIKRETNGYYRLTFETLEFDLWKAKIQLKNLSLDLNPEIPIDTLTIQNLYALKLSGLIIELGSIADVYLKKELVVNNVRVINPSIHIEEINEPQSKTFSFRTGNLYQDISKYLKVFQLNNFQITNGTLRHSPSQFALGSIDFFILNFLVNASSTPDHSFYSESIELEIYEQSFRLADSLHAISFDRFFMSTKDSLLRFENFSVLPVSDTIAPLSDTTDLVIYNISIPTLELRGVDYFSAYKQNQLAMNEVFFQNAQIFIDKETYSNVDRKTNADNSLMSQLIQVFSQIKIEKFKFENTSLNIKTDKDHNYNYQHLQSERVDITLYNVLLDSSNYQFDDEKKYCDDLEISVKDYSSYLADSTHILQFNLFKASSLDSTFLFENFRITPIENSNDTVTLFNLDLPVFKLGGINFRALPRKQMLIKAVEILNPTIDVARLKRSGKRKTLSVQALFDLIKNDFELIKIDEVLLKKGALALQGLLTIQELDMRSSGFKLDDQIGSWHDLLQEPRFSAQRVSFNDDGLDLTGKKLEIHSKLHKMELDNWDFQYLKDRQSIHGTFENLDLLGFSLDSILTANSLQFDTLKVLRPDINIQFIESEESNRQAPTASNRYLDIVEGELTITGEDSTLLESSEINLSMQWGSENFIYYANLNRLRLKSPELGHDIRASNFMLNLDRSVVLNDVVITSDGALNEGGLKAQIPLLTLTDLDQLAFWQNNTLKADRLYIKAPDIDLTIDNDSTNNEGRQFFALNFSSVNVDGGSAIISSESQGDMINTKVDRFSANMEDFDYPGRALLSDSDYIFSSGISVDVEDLNYVLKKNDTLAIGRAAFRSKNQTLEIDTLRYRNTEKLGSCFIPAAKIMGFDLNGFVNEEELNLGSVHIMSPTVSIELPKGGKNKETIDLPYRKVDIGLFTTSNSKITLWDSTKHQNRTFSNVGLSISDLSTSRNVRLRKLPNHLESLLLNGDSLSFSLDDGYRLHIGKYDFQYPKNTFQLDMVSLKSAFSPTEYSNTLNYQKDWFDITASRLEFEGLNVQKWLEQGDFDMNKASIDGLNAVVYRDKTIPFPDTQVRALPQTMLRDLDMSIQIDTIEMTGDIVYQEKSEQSYEVGEMSFNALKASLYQVDSRRNAPDQPMQLIANGRIMNSGDFSAQVDFDLNHAKDQFSFTGEIRDMAIDSLNKMLRPIANLNIKSGFSDRIWFNIEANDEFAKGEMKFNYSNLKVQLLNPQSHDTRGLGPGIKSLFANTFLIKSKNPSLVLLRDGNIFVERDTSRAIFNYWGKALLSGAISSVGIKRSNKGEKRYFRERLTSE